MMMMVDDKSEDENNGNIRTVMTIRKYSSMKSIYILTNVFNNLKESPFSIIL